MRHVRATKLVLRNPVLFGYFESSAAFKFGATDLDNKMLASCSDFDAH